MQEVEHLILTVNPSSLQIDNDFKLSIILIVLLSSTGLNSKFKDAVQVYLQFTYNVLRYATVWEVLNKHDSGSQSGRPNTLRINFALL